MGKPKLPHLNIHRRKLTFALTVTIIGSILYIIYQIAMFTQIREVPEVEHEEPIRNARMPVLGIDPRLWHHYLPNEDDTFRCIETGKVIDYGKLNDNYCDCPDGSDEPGTDACADGVFFCSYRRRFGNFPLRIPSSKVNDKVCDCCDGSDEWGRRAVVDMENGRFVERGRCPELCKSNKTVGI